MDTYNFHAPPVVPFALSWMLVTSEIGIFLIGFLGIKLARALSWPYYFSDLRNLPGPKDDQFLVGQALRLLRTPGPNDLYVGWMRQWPEAPFIRYVGFFGSEVLLVNSVAAHRGVLQTKAYSFVKPAFFEKLVGEIIGKGLLFSVGAEHKRQRRLLADGIVKRGIVAWVLADTAKAKSLKVHFDRAIDKAGGVIEVTVESLFTKTTLDVVGVAILGVELGNLTSSTSSLDFEQCYHAVLAQPGIGKLITFINPFIPLRWLPVEANRSFIRANTELHRMLREAAQQRFKDVKAREEGGAGAEQTEGRDLLTFMVEASLAENEVLTEHEVMELLFQFVAAGHETTAGALTWTTYALAMHPDVQIRLREEIRSTLKEQPEPDYATIEGMHDLNNVVRESLRLYSPTLTAPREAGEDVEIAGVMIPKGTAVVVIPAMTQLNPAIWGEEVERFDPDRWDRLGSGEAASPYAFPVFSNGPRVCIGKAFAMLAVKTVLVEMVRQFTFEPVDREIRLDNPALTLKPTGGLRVKVRRVTE
ncbi:Cytochrome P450 [Pleurostoma richardsiae]|uniref:Cytochrome P450 n=1 Tax=Pleurostoma richardsiae TaxID=41990 RepID=A0AA38RB17_9PEZI|nr:Cytochrome P450 [Pleurostoma richardsiae]